MMDLLRRTFFLFCIATVLNVSWPSNATHASNFDNRGSVQAEIFSQNRISLQIMSGAFFSHINIGPEVPDFNYFQTNLRIGWMLTDPAGAISLLRGNLEAIAEVTNSVVYEEFGDYMGGVTALIRYNFLRSDSRFFAYTQGGAGVIYTDAYKDRSQRAIGQAIEFTPQFGLGFRYLINKRWSIDGEVMFQHISNAGLADRNAGVNALGGSIGLTCYFDSLFSSKPLTYKGEDKPLNIKTRPIKGNEEEVMTGEGEETDRAEEKLAIKTDYTLMRTRPLEALKFLAKREGEKGEAFSTKSGPPVPTAMVGAKGPQQGPTQLASKEERPLKGDLNRPSLTRRPAKGECRTLSSIELKTSKGKLKLIALANAPIGNYNAFFVDRPSRLVIDLPGRWRRPGHSEFKLKSDLVKRVRLGLHSDRLRVVMDFSGNEPLSTVIRQSEQGLAITLSRNSPQMTRVKIAPVRFLAKRPGDLTLAVR